MNSGSAKANQLDERRREGGAAEDMQLTEDKQRSNGIGRDTEGSQRLGSSKASMQQASKNVGNGTFKITD